MPTVIKHKIGSGVPLASALVQGELAIDTVNGRMYTKNSVGSVVELGTTPSTIDINAGTVDGISSLSTANGTDVSFAGVSGTKFFWDASAESLGIGQGVYSTTHALNLKGEGLAIKNDKNGSDNNWSTINNTDTGSSSNLSFSTGGKVDAVVFSHAGNVGIGTGSPNATLEVNDSSTSTSTGILRLSNIADSITTGTDVGRLEFYSGDNSTGGNSVVGSIGTSINGNTNAADMKFNINGTERMRIDSSGNVGIGTSSPSAALDVVGEATVGNGTYGIKLSYSAGSTAGVIDTADSATNLSVRTGGTERMRIDSSGNIGIGTSSPLVTLHAENTSSGALTEPFMIKNSGTATSTAVGMVFRTSTGSTNTDFKIQAIGTGANAADLKFLSDGDVERMRIDSSGNVGIGTSSPATALDVAGIGVGASAPTIRITNTADYGAGGWNGITTTGRLQFYTADPSGNAPLATAFVESQNDFVGGTLPNGCLVFGTATYNDAAGATERMRIDSSGNVGIGVTPAAWTTITNKLQVGKAALTNYSTNTVLGANWYYATANDRYISDGYASLYKQESGNHIWYNAPTGLADAAFSPSERMRIDSSGNLLVGRANDTNLGSPSNTTVGVGTNGAAGWIHIARNSSNAKLLIQGINGGTGTAAEFISGTTAVGTISYTASATAYNTSSDYRLKENVVPMGNASSRVLALKPCRFNFIADPDKTVDGFLAHEAQEVVPEAVHGVKDGMRTEEYEVSPAVEATYDEEGNELTPYVPAVMGTREVPDYQGIDQSKLVPLLTKALQEALERIAALEAKVG